MALIAAVGFILAGPVTEASAAPPPPSPTAGVPDDEPARPGFVSRAQWQIYQALSAETLDRHDPHFKKKLAIQVTVKQIIDLTGTGPTSLSLAQAELLIKAGEQYHRLSQGTLEGTKKQVTKTGDEIHALKQEVKNAKTPAERERAEKKLQKKQRQYKSVAAQLRALKETLPPDTKTQIKELDADINKLQNKIRDLEQKAKKHRLPGSRQQVLDKIPELREQLERARTERDRLGGGPDDGTSGTRPATPGPKTPPTNPGTGAAKPLPTGPATGGTKTSTGPATGRPDLTGPIRPGAKPPRGTGGWEAVGEVLGQAVTERKNSEHQELLEKARQDPALRARIIDENRTFADDNTWEELGRPFTGPEFTPGELDAVGPTLTELQKTLDTTQAKAAESNADPLYQQARVDCGGYDTCVTERTAKLRDQAAMAVAESTKKATESNADPLYQQARVDCGGYDTCVTERVDKLRDQAADEKEAAEKKARAVAESTKKATESNADPLYQQARVDCGGYDTCVTERTAKLRTQAADEKQEAAKNKEVE
ncbi:hypothetical protein ACFWHU_38340, partial [Streptomyces sp. NPDC060366]